MKSRIFLSYRREDAAGEAHAIRTALREQLGEGLLFVDTASLEPGAVWPTELRSALDRAETVVAVIGPDWLRAGTTEWGERRIDRDDDWVRQELAIALATSKRLIPVLVRGASMPPARVLPVPVQGISDRQVIELRRDYWDHDLKLLVAQLQPQAKPGAASSSSDPYPRNSPEGPDAIDDEKVRRILAKDLTCWKTVVSPLPEDPGNDRVELFREFQFKSFQDAINFMSQVAPGCDIAMHHPRWENLWKTVRVYLTTWSCGHRVSDRDIQMARYFDRAYADFRGSALVKAKR